MDSSTDEAAPAIAMAMRRIGMCEQAGTGLRMMQREWQALGHAAPIHANDRVHKAFETFLPEPRAADVVAVPSEDLRGNLRGNLRGGEEVSDQIAAIVTHLDGAMTRQALQRALGLADREHFRKAYLAPALDAGLVEMTQPDRPNSRSQRYRLTEAGKELRSQRGTRT